MRQAVLPAVCENGTQSARHHDASHSSQPCGRRSRRNPQEKGGCSEDAITKICLRDRTKADDRSRSGKAPAFVRRHMGCMYQAPAAVDGGIVKEPFHRLSAAPGNAILHLLRLFGYMNVNGT